MSRTGGGVGRNVDCGHEVLGYFAAWCALELVVGNGRADVCFALVMYRF